LLDSEELQKNVAACLKASLHSLLATSMTPSGFVEGIHIFQDGDSLQKYFKNEKRKTEARYQRFISSFTEFGKVKHCAVLSLISSFLRFLL
jgi:hypothetical protein